jgi:L-amino acid N-acyltransferase YncA
MTARARRRPRAVRGLIVRDARKNDLPALLKIYNDAVLASPATFDLEPQTLNQRRKWLSEHGGSHPLVVAEKGGRVIGYASLSKFRSKPGYSKSVEDSVYVHKEFQGMGVGTTLLKEVVARATKLGYHTVVAGVVPPNEASVRLHEGLGFVHVGIFREVGFKFSRWQDVSFYQLFLPAKRTGN